MFRCRVCEEKDRRISDLKDEISHLRVTLNPPPRPAEIRYEMEADNLLSGGNTEKIKTLADIEAETAETARLQKEQDSLLTGNY